MKALLLLSLFCCGFQNDKSGLLTILRDQQQHKKGFSIQDAYKLIYQANFGIAHILHDQDHAKQYLHEEMEKMSPAPSEPLIENISVTGEIIRINLRPFKKMNGSAELLFEVMKQSAAAIKDDREKFVQQWTELMEAVSRGKFDFDQAALKKFNSQMKKAGYPMVHHSDEYQKHNAPAYRVVKRDIFFKYFPELKPQAINPEPN